MAKGDKIACPHCGHVMEKASVMADSAMRARMSGGSDREGFANMVEFLTSAVTGRESGNDAFECQRCRRTLSFSAMMSGQYDKAGCAVLLGLLLVSGAAEAVWLIVS